MAGAQAPSGLRSVGPPPAKSGPIDHQYPQTSGLPAGGTATIPPHGETTNADKCFGTVGAETLPTEKTD